MTHSTCGCKSLVLDTVHTSNGETLRKHKCTKCGAIFYTTEFEIEFDEATKRQWSYYHRKNTVTVGGN